MNDSVDSDDDGQTVEPCAKVGILTSFEVDCRNTPKSTTARDAAMGCFGTVVVIAILVGYVAVLVNYPKQTLGSTAVLVIALVIGISALIQNERESNARYQAERRAAQAREEAAARAEEVQRKAVETTILYSVKTCGATQPLAVTVRNGSSRTLYAIDFSLTAHWRGHSTNLLKYGDMYMKWDRILAPSESATLCYSLPRSVAESGTRESNELVFEFLSQNPTFR